MREPIVLLTSGRCYHRIDDPRLVFHTAATGLPHINHWPVPVSVAIERGYNMCKCCRWEPVLEAAR